jgi:hypothetical protein
MARWVVGLPAVEQPLSVRERATPQASLTHHVNVANLQADPRPIDAATAAAREWQAHFSYEHGSLGVSELCAFFSLLWMSP